MTETPCVSCARRIDETARICPFCGADPTTGAKIDTQAMLQEVFQPRQLSTSETVLEYARHRQGLVIAGALITGFLLLAAIHQVITMRNRSTVTTEPAVPLTEIADLSRQTRETQHLPMPELQFQHDGRPQAMRTYILEPGAVPPPEVVALQQAAAAQAQQPGMVRPAPAAQAPVQGPPTTRPR